MQSAGPRAGRPIPGRRAWQNSRPQVTCAVHSRGRYRTRAVQRCEDARRHSAEVSAGVQQSRQYSSSRGAWFACAVLQAARTTAF